MENLKNYINSCKDGDTIILTTDLIEEIKKVINLAEEKQKEKNLEKENNRKKSIYQPFVF